MSVVVAEIPNIDVIRDLIAGAELDPDHAELKAALTARYPGLNWRVATYAEEWSMPGKQVLDPTGAVVAENRKAWLRELVAAAGSPAQVWREHRDRDLATIDEEGTTVYAGAAIGPRPEDVLEIRIDWVKTARAEAVFPDRISPPADIDDLLEPCMRSRASWQPPTRPRYELRRMNQIARTLVQAETLELAKRQHKAAGHTIMVSEVVLGRSDLSTGPVERSILELDPDYLKRALRERRFLDDWAASSASAVPVIEHWAFDVEDYVYRDERFMGITPRPVTWAPDDREIRWEEGRSLYQLMDLLERFDDAVGHPMAWFFHATYGNQVGQWAIRDVAEGLRRKKIGLPKADIAVISRWAASEYGF